MTHVSLFTGIGGLDLAAEAAGIKTVLQVEREPYALRILERHWPNVPRITEVRDVTRSSIDGPVTVVSGGFPCQPFSAAGKRRGSDDDRYLWPELLRIVEELQPSWVVGENVSGLLSIDDGMEIDRLLASLEAANYEPWVLHYPAAGVGAYHKRDRVFIVAHARDKSRRDSERREFTGDGSGKLEERKRADQTATTSGPSSTPGDVAYRTSEGLQERRRPEWKESAKEAGAGMDNQPQRCSQDVADADNTRPQGRQEAGDAEGIGAWRNKHTQRRGNDTGPTRPTESRLGGMADGLSNWVDGEPDIPRVATGIKDRAARLKTLGNAVVPAQAYPIFKAIAELQEEL